MTRPGPFGSRLIREERPLRVAYADPPYLGVAHRYPEKTEVDHVALFAQLEREFPDGWALSGSAKSLPDLMRICPPGTRVAAWCKPFSGGKPGVAPVYAWEPVLFLGGRKRERLDPGPRDFLICDVYRGATGGAPFSPGRGPAYEVLGQKPAAFCRWIFELLALAAGDELVDLFPGSGAVARAWAAYRSDLAGSQLELVEHVG